MGARLKLAVAVLAALIVTEQAPVPVQAPLQPANVEPLAGVAVRPTIAPEEYEAVHVAPQLMPEGDEITVPVPVPARLTVNE